jgi:hypothetical protein
MIKRIGIPYSLLFCYDIAVDGTHYSRKLTARRGRGAKGKSEVLLLSLYRGTEYGSIGNAYHACAFFMLS